MVQQRADRLGAEKHRLDQPARVQQPVGEDVAAIGIGAELDLIDGDEFGRAVQRHRLDRAGEPARLRRHDLFLAGDQGDVAHALAGDHAVVILTREQPEREADDAGRVGQHPIDRQMGLAGIGRPQHGLDLGHKVPGHEGPRRVVPGKPIPGRESGHKRMFGCSAAKCKRPNARIALKP